MNEDKKQIHQANLAAGPLCNEYNPGPMKQNSSISLNFRSQERPGLENLTGYSETILIVDDEEMVVSACRRMLQYLGYTIITAHSGKKALAIYREDPQAIDLILLDIMMPGLDGGATYDALKKFDPQVKVLLSSGFSLDNQTKNILSKGCNGFIQKPYTLKEIAQKIREVLAAER